jgi:hypothetical protein
VSCSESASLLNPEYQLYLRNTQTRYDVENLAIALGYKHKTKEENTYKEL